MVFTTLHFFFLKQKIRRLSKNITNKINQKWLKWFVGFNDEGNFQVYPKKIKVGRDK